MTVSRSATSGSTWMSVDVVVAGVVLVGRRRSRGCPAVWSQLPRSGCSFGERGSGSASGSRLDVIVRHRLHRTGRRPGSCRVASSCRMTSHAREVHPLATGQETDDTHPLDVGLTVETEVVAPLRADEALLVVDPQRAGMARRQLGGDADEVARPLSVASPGHAVGTLISIWRGLDSSAFGMDSRRRPLSKVASAFSPTTRTGAGSAVEGADAPLAVDVLLALDLLVGLQLAADDEGATRERDAPSSRLDAGRETVTRRRHRSGGRRPGESASRRGSSARQGPAYSSKGSVGIEAGQMAHG